jgi:phosphoglycolate phosphatase
VAIAAIVYDLDGTLLDSSGTITWATNRTRAALGLDPLRRAEVMAAVGDGARRLVERTVCIEVTAPVDKVLEIFMGLYRADPISGSTTYPGVLESLEYWHAAGVPQAILTNKPHSATTIVVGALGLDRWCAHVLGVNKPMAGGPLPAKPAPDGLQWIINTLGVDPGDTWMVGDGVQDMRVARHAGTRSLGIRGGFGNASELEGLDPPPDALVGNFQAAHDYLLGL